MEENFYKWMLYSFILINDNFFRDHIPGRILF